ncbi:MAG: DUF4340 domain-containing protein [Alphaproteobacteria bacterium]
MLWKKTVVMIVAFTALTALALLSSALSTGGAGPRLSLPPVAKDAVTKIEIQGGETPVTLEKSGEQWLVQPGGYPADARQIETALGVLENLSFGSMISKSPSRFETYEVQDGGFTLVVHTGQGELWRLLIGKDSADRRGNYVRLSDGKRVFVSNGRLRATFEKPLDRWRDRTITKLERDLVVKLELAVGGQTLAFSRSEDGEWAFDPTPVDLPADYRLDADKVDKAIRALVNLTASEFVEGEVSLAETGLEPPVARATMTLRGDETVTVLLGNEKEKDKFYARRADQSQIYVISSHQQKNIQQDLAALRDLHVAPFAEGQAVKVEIREGQRTLVLVKENENWRLASSSEEAPDGFVLDGVKVESLVRSAARLQGKTLVGRSAPASAGLGRPRGVITVTLDDGTVKRIRIGDETEDKEAYVAGDRDLVFLVSSYSAKALLKKLEDLQVTRQQPQQQQQMFSPEALQKLPPALRQQIMQQQRQKIMQNQMMRQMMKKQEKKKQNE